MPYINRNPYNTPQSYNPEFVSTVPVRHVVPSEPYIGPQQPPKGPYGKLSNDGFLINYDGLTSDTAEVIIDNANRTIKVNVNVDAIRENPVIEIGSASHIWTIEHNLNRYPIVTVVDMNMVVCLAEIQYLDKNTVQVRFSEPKAGKVILS